MKPNLFYDAYKGSYYTITGCGGCLKDWTEGYEKLMEREGIGKPKEWHAFNGKEINEALQLTGNNRYQDDLTFLCFPTDGLAIGKLAIFKIKMEDRWFDDIVNDNLEREGGTFSEVISGSCDAVRVKALAL